MNSILEKHQLDFIEDGCGANSHGAIGSKEQEKSVSAHHTLTSGIDNPCDLAVRGDGVVVGNNANCGVVRAIGPIDVSSKKLKGVVVALCLAKICLGFVLVVEEKGEDGSSTFSLLFLLHYSLFYYTYIKLGIDLIQAITNINNTFKTYLNSSKPSPQFILTNSPLFQYNTPQVLTQHTYSSKRININIIP